ncbi:hypothetical protein AMQ84_06650 [Paenibacillus riograndensis]|uniref:Uncharacterized protein n=1 Tax=Paenibacillus riograndensis TaxID=483937 RepID=A0A132U865_9BACL|nr:hypothetical protein AMQ84_06650 [Paenibacillus riograndensis]KWX84185.1 hypothetical protein AMQ83_29590 [Paenibacillus riograndensis]
MILLIALVLWVIGMVVLMIVIRKAVDGSRTSDKLDILIEEIRMLRKEIRESKHIIDKRL